MHCKTQRMEQVVRKSNKENTKPPCDSRKQAISSVVSKQKILSKSVTLRSKPDLKEDNSGREKDARPKINTKDANPTRRQTLSQAFRTQQSVRTRKLVEEVQKPPSTVLQKSKPGTYKGRVIQSKIDCFRKPSTDVKTAEKKVISKPDVAKPKTELSKVRSKSVTSLPASTRPALNSAFSYRTKSVSDFTEKPLQRSGSQKPIPPKVPAPTCPTGRQQVRAPRPAPLTTGRSVASKPIASKSNEAVVQGAKPKPAVATTERNVRRPVTSTLSQYRVQMETADERRAKLAEWLASKGKMLKRPPVPETATNSRKPATQLKSGPKAASIGHPAPVNKPESVSLDPGVKMDSQNDDTKIQKEPSCRSSNIMNTTLDLLDNSDMDLPVDPEINMESLVINLCDKLEAMETPSACEDDTNEVGKADALTGENTVEEQETDKGFEILEEEELDEEENITEANIKHEDKETKEKKPNVSEDDDSEEEMEGASIVKYNVKTTPYLQSVRKRIECESAPGSGSRHKSTIKDLKFLTPVRRSTRIQRKSSRLPGMLNDHDTCVSSLAELVQLDDADASAYIYRKNPALLEDLPDQPGDFGNVCS